MKNLLIILVMLSGLRLNAQFPFTKTVSFGKFENASAFSITDNGYVYVADSYSNEIFKFDTLGTLFKFIGGYGWEDAQFDEPADIYANTLNVYVADKNNNRIQIFDKDLNFLSGFKNQPNEESDLGFAYPVSCVVSGQGDLFILDSDNSRILEYDLNGNFLQEIGGIDAGDFSVTQPEKLAISADGKIYVLDDGLILVYDYYGNGLFKIKIGFNATNIGMSGNSLSVNNESQITVFNLRENSSLHISKEQLGLSDNANIVEAVPRNNKIYVLTETEIIVYTSYENQAGK